MTYLVKIGGQPILTVQSLPKAKTAATMGVTAGSWRAIVIERSTGTIVYAKDAD